MQLYISRWFYEQIIDRTAFAPSSNIKIWDHAENSGFKINWNLEMNRMFEDL